MEYRAGIECCPICKSIYIQYDESYDQCYCLVRECGHRWEEDIDFDNLHQIRNPYLRTSIKRIPA